jgi:hypothetical protein
MRVKLQLVVCHDDGYEETVTDIITLTKNNQRIEHLGLTFRTLFSGSMKVFEECPLATCGMVL